jgi:hypothetical protein
MPEAIKVLSEEIELSTTANTVSSASLVRVINITESFALLTKRDSANNVLGSLTIGPRSATFGEAYIIKQPSDTLESNVATTLYVCSVGYF